MLTLTSPLSARELAACSSRAARPLPVPFSPVMSTGASAGPTLAMVSSTGRMAADPATYSSALPALFGRPVVSPQSFRRKLFSDSSRALRRRMPASSIWVRTVASTRAFSQGFWMKSRAPRRMASTARSTVAQAVMTTTGGAPSVASRRPRRSRPSWPLVVSRV